MAELSLYLFGAPRVEHGGAMVSLGRRKSMALLSYLAVTGRRYHRETLAALLWPESPPDAAFSALRNVLWILRQTPVDRVIRSDRSTVEILRDGSLWVDVNEFRSLVVDCPTQTHARTAVCDRCAPLLEQAVSLAQGAFMDGFSAQSAPGFDDWQLSESVALRRELTETLDRLVTYYATKEDWAQAASLARRWVELDTLDEAGHRRLMEALVAQGKRTEALTCFEECARALHEELNLKPEEATVALAERIRASAGGGGPAHLVHSNLPAGLLPLIGRKAEATTLSDLLRTRKTRLITLVGLGGSGKSHLAFHVGRELVDAFADGVFVVSLDTLNGDRYVSSEIARVLGVRLLRGESSSLPHELADHLRERKLLLILDGAEGIGSQARLLIDMLSAAEGVMLLVTSREPLDVRGEEVISIEGLPVPEDSASIETLRESDAVRLLQTTSSRLRSGRTEDSEEAWKAMSRIARLVDGLPLGLEIAAGWSRVLSWPAIVERMSEAEELPHRGRDVPERHRSLRAVYEETWRMLSDDEQRTLRRLSVFHDGFSIEAAESVAQATPASLAGLTNRCLIRRVTADRYEIHELLRQFSLERLEEAKEEASEARAAHAEFFVSRLEHLFEEMKGREQVAALRRVRSDIGNVRIAWRRAAEMNRLDLLERAGEAMFFYYDVTSFFEEGQHAFEDILTPLAEQKSPSAMLGLAEMCYGWFLKFVFAAESDVWMRAGLGHIDSIKPFGPRHAVCNLLACYSGLVTSRSKAAARLKASLKYYRRVKDRWSEALTLTALAVVVPHEDPMEAESLAVESLEISRQIEDVWGQALTLDTLAHFAELRGELGLAKVRYHQSHRLATLIGADLFPAIDSLISESRVAGLLGQRDEAEDLIKRALQQARDLGHSVLTARALRQWGRQAASLGEYDAARNQLIEALQLLQARAQAQLAAACAVDLGNVERAAGDDASAVGWYREALGLNAECTDAHDRLRELGET